MMYVLLFIIGIICFIAVPALIVVTVLRAKKGKNVSILIWSIATSVVLGSCACVLAAMLYAAAR